NLFQSLVGVASVQLETAGSAKKEVAFAALSKTTAEALKNRLESFIEELPQVENANNQEENTSKNTAQQPKRPSKKLLLKLDIIDLFKIGITQNHLRNGFLALVAVYSFSFQFSLFDWTDLDPYFSSLEEQDASKVFSGFAIILVAVGIVLFILISILLSLAKTVIDFYDFKLEADEKNLYIRTGLLVRKEYKVPINKIQMLEFESNPLRKIFGFETLKVLQAQPEDVGNKQSKSIYIPACTPPIAKNIETLVFDYTDEHLDIIQPNATSYARISAIYWMLFFGVIFIGFWVFLNAYLINLTLLAILGLASISWSYYFGKSVSLASNEDFFVSKYSFFTPTRCIIPNYKLQNLTAVQPIFLKQRKEAHLKLFTASGDQKIRYLKLDVLQRVYNFGLEKVIGSKRAWM
ncbi:MAG: PH domain-containing protein, partial [Flavobacteriaceae bacterium]|nr:PH domain-containing protein [Flavobacteriaceae bacterium]